MTQQKLKPCPFCGADPDGPEWSDGIGDTFDPYYWIDCSNEDCHGYQEARGAKALVIEKWNRRDYKG